MTRYFFILVVKNKSTSLTLALFLSVLLAANAQFNYGVVRDYEWKPSYQLGVFSSYNFNRNFAISADLVFQNKGFSTSNYYGYSADTDDIKLKQQLHYISFFGTTEWNYSARFSLLGGFYYGVLLSAPYSPENYYGFKVKSDASDQFKSTDIGLTAGLKYQVTPRLHLISKFEHGLRDISKLTSTNPRLNKGFQFGIGYNLRKIESLRPSDSARHERLKTRATIGIRQGISNNTFKETYNYLDNSISSKTSYEVGAEVRFDVISHLYTSFGLMYQQRSAIFDKDTPIENLLDVRYIAIPVLGGFTPIKTKYFSLSTEAGLSANFLISKTVPDFLEEKNLYVRKVNVSAFYGYELNGHINAKTGLFFNYRRSEDIGRFASYSDTNLDQDMELFNKTETFAAGVRFKLKHGAERSKKVHRDSTLIKESMKPISHGIKGGINFNNSSFTNLPSDYKGFNKTQLGYHLGYYVQIRIFKKTAFVQEIQYTTRGLRVKTESNKENVKVGFMDLSILLSRTITKTIFLEAGASIGMSFGTGDGALIDEGTYFHYKTNIEKALVAGVKYRASPKLFFGCRYYRVVAGDDSFQNADFSDSRTKNYMQSIQLTTYWQLSKKR